MEKCKFWDNTNRGILFDCMKCGEEQDQGNFDNMHICFSHQLVLCDECYDEHYYKHTTQEERDNDDKKWNESIAGTNTWQDFRRKTRSKLKELVEANKNK